ncbi:ThiF family adenylyltransferase [Alteromonas sp. NFXS44]|uniref:ThiF family adenylyltransferase n=1 Tax=Alteromonas sp. NFXS44 TaxID=2818435 RepID=UPI0032DE9A50
MTNVVQSVPYELQEISDLINADPRTETISSWVFSEGKIWSLKFIVQLSVQPSQFMPVFSSWHLVIWQEGTFVKIEMYPDKKDGISVTFQHQDSNYKDETQRPWTAGKPCLENAFAVFGRCQWLEEPEELADRVLWRLNRLQQWIDAAALENLAVKGEPLELPAFTGHSAYSQIGFAEKTDELKFWQSMIGKWGYASISVLQGTLDTRYIREFYNSEKKLIRRSEWSPAMCNRPKIKDIIWFMLPALPILQPWQAPRTWMELNQSLKNLGLSFSDFLVDIGCSLRKAYRRRLPKTLMLGFPLQEKVGEEPQHIHWLALRLSGISDNSTTRRGFRSTERNRREWDREQSLSREPIKWVRTQNWTSGQLRTRGEISGDIQSKKILIIGAGSLGSAISENLLRIGVVSLGILDSDYIQVGNLSRHALTMSAVGRNKAVALAEHLNCILPDANARSFNCDFPPESEFLRNSLSKFDVVVDCTGEDKVLKAMSDFDWQSEKVFVSLAMTWKAEGLFAYAAKETIFPVIDAISHFKKCPSPEIDVTDAKIEGVGCWHPVFPARAEDVNLWAAIGTKFICRVVGTSKRTYEYFKQNQDGTVERQTHEH